MTFKTFWCGRCNRNKPMEQLVSRRRGSAICRSCEDSRLKAMKNVREQRKQLQNRETA